MKKRNRQIHKILVFAIALVWFANGLIAKFLDFVPRHAEIVGRILGEEHAQSLTKMIGLAEIAMAVWIVSRIWSRINAAVQIALVLIMNLIEIVFAKELLLFGYFNLLFAGFFVFVVYYNEFIIGKNPQNAVIS